MKVNLKTSLKAFDGADVTDATGPVLISTLCINALMKEDTVAGAEKMKRFLLARRIYDAEGDLDITVEEASLIKDLVGSTFAPIVVGRVYELLEGV